MPEIVRPTGSANVGFEAPIDFGWSKHSLRNTGISTAEAEAFIAEAKAQKDPVLRSVSVHELLELDIKPREILLHPFLPSQGLVMLYSKRGVGKTFIALGISVAVASGGEFLQWRAPKTSKVLYVDGEMPCATLRERIASIVAGSKTSPMPENLRIITPDLQNRGLPDLSSIGGQDEIEQHLDGVELLVLDNLSCLVRAVKENEGEGWLPVQDWALTLRRRGISVLFVHHAGKGGAQRGTSRREDLLDSVLTLKHPSDYSASDGLRCQVVFEKSRSFFGPDARPFELQMSSGVGGESVWTVTDSEVSQNTQAAELFSRGLSVRDVAEAMEISKSQAHRIRQGLNGTVSQNQSSGRK